MNGLLGKTCVRAVSALGVFVVLGITYVQLAPEVSTYYELGSSDEFLWIPTIVFCVLGFMPALIVGYGARYVVSVAPRTARLLVLALPPIGLCVWLLLRFDTDVHLLGVYVAGAAIFGYFLTALYPTE